MDLYTFSGTNILLKQLKKNYQTLKNFSFSINAT